MPEAFVGCGSNVDPERNLRWALAALRERYGAIRCSNVYRSPAFGFDGPDFLNMVIGFQTDSDADGVEAAVSELENACGRDAGGRSGSRTLDLDLLLFGERIDAARRLPRADILEYPFVLIPLDELIGERRHPLTGRRYRDIRADGLAGMDTMVLSDFPGSDLPADTAPAIHRDDLTGDVRSVPHEK
jgi:2-amino-4-hydroxy-6-hydroxymethyldihydropteridine diphosphokinase